MGDFMTKYTPSPESIKQLREKSGCGMMDCRTALEKMNGDMLLAEGWLNAKALAVYIKTDREGWNMEQAQKYKDSVLKEQEKEAADIILKMIEDGKSKGVINRAVFKYRFGKPIPSTLNKKKFDYVGSRDALKELRPKGWDITVRTGDNDLGCICTIHKWIDNTRHSYVSPILPTEELAELHAIIQAINFERSN